MYIFSSAHLFAQFPTAYRKQLQVLALRLRMQAGQHLQEVAASRAGGHRVRGSSWGIAVGNVARL